VKARALLTAYRVTHSRQRGHEAIFLLQGGFDPNKSFRSTQMVSSLGTLVRVL
jgi:hypothetical protein